VVSTAFGESEALAIAIEDDAITFHREFVDGLGFTATRAEQEIVLPIAARPTEFAYQMRGPLTVPIP